MLDLHAIWRISPRMGAGEGTTGNHRAAAQHVSQVKCSQSRSLLRHPSLVPLCLLDSWAKMRALQLFQPLAKFIPEVEEPSGGKRVQFK